MGTDPATGPPSPAASDAPDPTMSVDYCQELDSGKWVTNNSASSSTPCVPDPTYATGDEQADASLAVPRCLTCKLSDWKRAERRAAEQTGLASPTSVATPATNPAGGNKWSRDVRSSFISDCTAYMTGSLCECLANHLGWEVPADQAEGLSGDDPRVQAAGRDCRS